MLNLINQQGLFNFKKLNIHNYYTGLSEIVFIFSDNKDYRGYLPLDLLESGIKSGIYIKGQLEVNKHKAQHEAFVHRTE